jgi:hypothetical protein
MTTKNEDAVKVLRELCELRAVWTDPDNDDLRRRADIAIANLSQQREAGAVAWMHEDGERVITAAQKRNALNDGGASASSVAPYSHPLVHPAQAASQEGEDANGDDPSPSDYRRCLKCGFVVDVALGSCKPGTDAPMLAHPTGDRARYRALGSKDFLEADDEFLDDDCTTWLRAGDRAKLFIGQPYTPGAYQPARRRIAAALDQEKGR